MPVAPVAPVAPVNPVRPVNPRNEDHPPPGPYHRPITRIAAQLARAEEYKVVMVSQWNSAKRQFGVRGRELIVMKANQIYQRKARDGRGSFAVVKQSLLMFEVHLQSDSEIMPPFTPNEMAIIRTEGMSSVVRAKMENTQSLLGEP